MRRFVPSRNLATFSKAAVVAEFVSRVGNAGYSSFLVSTPNRLGSLMISYSQNFEDVLLWRTLGHIDSGFYIDIGAWSPTTDSVTRFFYESGWRGINVDPLPEAIAQFDVFRPRDINVLTAISALPNGATFFAVRETGLSTFDPEAADAARTLGYTVEPIAVPTLPLEFLWDNYVPKGQDVHFLKIDVEGHEKNVITSGNWERHRPWVVVVEATRPLTQIAVFEEWEKDLLDNRYVYCWFDGLNRYYVSEERRDLGRHLAVQPNVFDNFVSGEVIELRRELEKVKAHLSQEVVE